MTIGKLQLLIATKNAGKVKELELLLAHLPIRLRRLDEFPMVADAVESGATFAENAQLKAGFYAAQTGLASIADDSGLAVEALGGAPGVFSARYAGENATDAERIGKLLEELDATGDERRRAHFVCAVAISDAGGEIKHLVEATCAGVIASAPTGENGFGYDSIFIPDRFSETFGQLPDETKREISHRARAIKKIIAHLRDFTVHSLDL